MWQTLLGLAPLTLVAGGLSAWTAMDVVRSLRAQRQQSHGRRRG